MVNAKVRLIILLAAEGGEALYSQQKQDLELTVAQIMNSLLQNSGLNGRKLGKPLDHSGNDQNQISYDYTMEVTNRFKGLDLVDRVPEELWMEVHNTVQEPVIKTIPRKRKAKRQNVCLRRLYK